MTVTLCIETSGPHCSLALAVDEQIYIQERMLARSHNEHMLNMLDALFVQAGCRPADVDLVAFGCGPGSFTGVRISASAAQAVAVAANALVVPVPSSKVLAFTAATTNPGSATIVCSLPSRGQAYYLSAYRRIGSDALASEVLANDVLAVIYSDELVESCPAWLLQLAAGEGDSGDFEIVGTAPSWLADDLAERVRYEVHPAASEMVSYARRVHEQGQSLPPEQALPLYVTGDSPWRKQALGQ